MSILLSLASVDSSGSVSRKLILERQNEVDEEILLGERDEASCVMKHRKCQVLAKTLGTERQEIEKTNDSLPFRREAIAPRETILLDST